MAENTMPTVYVICDQNCKFEGMTKEQILAAIMQAVSEGTIRDVDAGFITKIKTINNKTLRFFVGEQSQYDGLSDDEKQNLFAIITNDTTKEGLLSALENLATDYFGFKENALQLPTYDGGDFVYTKKLRQIEQFTEEGLYYAQMQPTDGGTVRPLGVFYYCRYPSHLALFIGGDDANESLRVKIYTGGDYSVVSLATNTDVTENYKIYATKLGG